ncbi:MAG TPA: FkbM family methyltransferase, partial [Pseudolabrys sp.]|nr:FkbM family methyltransferase [Pseudolabrys sp.]
MFAGPTDAAAAAALLAEMAGAPCAFAPVPMDRPLALYGGGSLGRLAREFLTAVGRDFALVVDRNAGALAQDPYWSGVRLLHPDEVRGRVKREARLAVSIVTSAFVPLESSLRALGFDDVVPFYDLAESFRAVHPLSNGWFAPALKADETERTSEVLTRWDDDMSRAHHLQFVAWRRLREEWTFADAPVTIGDRFFIPEVTDVLTDREVFVDAGAHRGSVIDAFLARTDGAFRTIAAIEPDAANRAVLAQHLAGRPDTTIYDCALAEGDGEATFHEGLGYASQLSPTGKMRVATRPLDALGLAPSFIKFHLEGGELAALQGARATLLTHRPIVAATVYHNADGIWRTPRW